MRIIVAVEACACTDEEYHQTVDVLDKISSALVPLEKNPNYVRLGLVAFHDEVDLVIPFQSINSGKSSLWFQTLVTEFKVLPLKIKFLRLKFRLGIKY